MIERSVPRALGGDTRVSLERVALRQTRLRAPGLGLDARGVALGRRALVLLPSLDRVVALLAATARVRPLEAALPGATVVVGRTLLGSRGVLLAFDAESSDHVDRVAATARLVGGLVFTGTHRHFVQYRDASAPHGYDLADPVATDAEYALYHDGLAQTFEADRSVDLAHLVRAVRPSPDPSPPPLEGPLWVLAERGVGPAFANHLVRSRAGVEVGRVRWPGAVSNDGPEQWLMRVTDVPARLTSLLRTTPGVRVFVPRGYGVAVELGYRHPVPLDGSALYPEGGLVLFRGREEPALVVPELPPLVDARVLRSVTVGDLDLSPVAVAADPLLRSHLSLRRAGTVAGPPAASLVSPESLPLLRRLAYSLDRDALRSTRVALLERGALLVREPRLEGLPLGKLFRCVHPHVFVEHPLEFVPRVAPDVLFAALGAPADRIVFLEAQDGARAQGFAVPTEAFVALEAALVEGPSWAPLEFSPVEDAFDEPLSRVRLDPLGAFPLAGFPPESEGAGS